MMSSGERGLSGLHSKVTLEPNGTDLVETCADEVLGSSGVYGGGACWAL